MVWINMWRRNGSMESSVLGGTAGRLLRDYCQSTAWRLVLLMAPSWSERARHLLATTHCHFGLFLVICIPFTYFQNQIYIRSKFSSSFQLHVIAYVSNKSSFSFRLLECFFFFFLSESLIHWQICSFFFYKSVKKAFRQSAALSNPLSSRSWQPQVLPDWQPGVWHSFRPDQPLPAGGAALQRVWNEVDWTSASD